jgi:chromosome segregation ATPase
LSTLTKILIVLLAVSSIFLCGIVVNYVANSTDYKQKYEKVAKDYSAAEKNTNNYKEQFNKEKEDFDKQKEDLNKQISDLGTQITQLKTQLQSAEVAKEEANKTIQNWTSVIKQHSTSVEQFSETLQKTLAENTTMKDELIEKGKQLEETSTALTEKEAIIASLENDKKQLIEEKTELLNRINKSLLTEGKQSTTPSAVTQNPDAARPVLSQALSTSEPLNINGQISALDLNNKTAKISVGAANGVKTKMIFNVYRGSKFIALVEVFDVEQSNAAGTLMLVQDRPKVGDTVSTNLNP